MNGNITANHILLSEEKNENQHDESAKTIIQQCNHALYKSWQKIELCSMDNLRKPKYPWCSDSTHHISNGLKRNTEKQRQSCFDCFFAVDCGQFMVQAQFIFTCNVCLIFFTVKIHQINRGWLETHNNKGARFNLMPIFLDGKAISKLHIQLQDCYQA